MTALALVVLCTLLLTATRGLALGADGDVLRVRFGGDAQRTRVVIDLDASTRGTLVEAGGSGQLVVDLDNIRAGRGQSGPGMGLPLWRLLVAAVCVAVGQVAAESAGTVDVRVVALALPDYGEATARVWRALGVDGLHVGCGPALRPRALNSDLESPVAAAGVDAAFTGIDGVDASRRYFLRHDATTPFPLPSGAFPQFANLERRQTTEQNIR